MRKLIVLVGLLATMVMSVSPAMAFSRHHHRHHHHHHHHYYRYR